MNTQPGRGRPRRQPCASCPYRRDVPSGLWAAEEYEKLPDYDGPTWGQSPAVFACHKDTGDVCAGWLGHTDPAELLAVRLGINTGDLDPECLTYRTDVPLWPTGAAAAHHGLADVANPGPRAERAIAALVHSRTTRQRRT